MMKQEKKAEKAPILLTEAETDHVAGGTKQLRLLDISRKRLDISRKRLDISRKRR
jgi:hypothetical protein